MDGVVNIVDFLGVLSSRVPSVGCPADINVSGAVDVTDLLILLSHWGPCE